MASKSPIKDYSRLLGVDRTVKKEENLYRMHTSERIYEELRNKLDLSLRHNSKLLDENAALSELVSKLRNELKEMTQQFLLLTVSENGNITKVQAEHAALMEELEVKQLSHEAEVKRLLDEVSRLHNEKNELEIAKNKQLDLFRQQHEKNLSGCIQSIRSTHENSKDIYETQIRKLRQTIEERERELQSVKTEQKLQNGRLQQTITNLEGEIEHIKKLHTLQMQQVKNTYGMELHKERRTLVREMDNEASNHQLVIKRMKNEMQQKTEEIGNLMKKMANNDEMHSLQLESLKREKEILASEITTMEVNYANSTAKEKLKMKQINEQQIKNILDLNETHIGQLRSQITHLKELLDCKTTEIKRLLEQNTSVRKTMTMEIQLQTKTNEELRIRMKAMERDGLESMEALKIKMAQLFDADMKSLVSYYHNEIGLLQTNINELQEINKANKSKLYKALEDNDEIRKIFEMEISKQKARVQDLKIKLAALNLQHKEHVTSLATKMELTSQTLVREAEQKHNSQAFFEQEKKKFHSLSNAKDAEIIELLQTMNRMKKMHEDEIATLRAEKSDLREQIQTHEEREKEMKKQFEEELKKKEDKLKRQVKPQDDKEKELIKELYDKNEKLENENIKLQKQVQHLARENRAISGQLGLKKGFIETLHLESSAAIEDEKTKLRTLMGNSEMSLKEYFQDKLVSKDKDIQHLQNVLAGKEDDIRDLIVKYNGLEKRLQTLLASQQKLRDLQERIKNLGMDNNLVKNMAQLFNRPQLRIVH